MSSQFHLQLKQLQKWQKMNKEAKLYLFFRRIFTFFSHTVTFSAVRIENGSFAWNALNAPLLRE